MYTFAEKEAAVAAQKGQKRPGGDMRYTVIKLRLHPTQEQAELLEKTFGCCRWLWNRMLSDTEEFYAATDLHYIPTPARYKKEAPFLREVDSQPLCCVHQNLRQAYLDFFRNPAAFGPPRFKTKKARRDSFTVYCRQYRTGPSIYLTKSGLQMPKAGLIPATIHRRPRQGWLLRYVTVSKSRSGKYFASIAFGYEVEAPARVTPTAERTLGLNQSLSRFYVDSGGNSPELPALEKSMEKLARIQRRLSRMEPGSGNYREQLQKLRLQYEHIANQRRDFIHKESRRIANAWDAVCVRQSDLGELPRAVRSGAGPGFGMFRACLKYKLERQGKWYVAVDSYAPVAKVCHACGRVNEALAPRERVWTCPHCGASVTREVNTAQNLRDMGLAQLQSKANSVA